MFLHIFITENYWSFADNESDENVIRFTHNINFPISSVCAITCRGGSDNSGKDTFPEVHWILPGCNVINTRSRGYCENHTEHIHSISCMCIICVYDVQITIEGFPFNYWYLRGLTQL